MRTRFVSSVVVLIFLTAPAGVWAKPDTVTPERFKALHSLIKPAAAEEKWAQIPWMSGLWDARQKAAAEGKPILLWEMDGHPLGCV